MLTATANAKLNLYLHIHGKREDGYHLIETLVAFTRFGDELSVVADDDVSLIVKGEFADIAGAGDDNLVLRAAWALQEACKVEQGARITLTKHIPVGAGLGGGSADAAAVLKLLCKLWAVIPSRVQMHEIAVSLGADVPMCLEGKPLVARGIGEDVSPLAEALPPLHVVLVYPHVALSTPSVYQRYQHEQILPTPAPDGITARTFFDSLKLTRNQLQRAAISLSPEVAEVLLVLEGYPQAGMVRMCGSGSTSMALVDNAAAAEAMAKDIAKRYPHWWVKTTQVA